MNKKLNLFLILGLFFFLNPFDGYSQCFNCTQSVESGSPTCKTELKYGGGFAACGCDAGCWCDIDCFSPQPISTVATSTITFTDIPQTGIRILVKNNVIQEFLKNFHPLSDNQKNSNEIFVNNNYGLYRIENNIFILYEITINGNLEIYNCLNDKIASFKINNNKIKEA